MLRKTVMASTEGRYRYTPSCTVSRICICNQTGNNLSQDNVASFNQDSPPTKDRAMLLSLCVFLFILTLTFKTIVQRLMTLNSEFVVVPFFNSVPVKLLVDC